MIDISRRTFCIPVRKWFCLDNYSSFWAWARGGYPALHRAGGCAKKGWKRCKAGGVRKLRQLCRRLWARIFPREGRPEQAWRKLGQDASTPGSLKMSNKMQWLHPHPWRYTELERLPSLSSHAFILGASLSFHKRTDLAPTKSLQHIARHQRFTLCSLTRKPLRNFRSPAAPS